MPWSHCPKKWKCHLFGWVGTVSLWIKKGNYWTCIRICVLKGSGVVSMRMDCGLQVYIGPEEIVTWKWDLEKGLNKSHKLLARHLCILWIWSHRIRWYHHQYHPPAPCNPAVSHPTHSGSWCSLTASTSCLMKKITRNLAQVRHWAPQGATKRLEKRTQEKAHRTLWYIMYLYNRETHLI